MVNKKKKTPYAALAENLGPPLSLFLLRSRCTSFFSAAAGQYKSPKKVMRSLQHVRCIKRKKKEKKRSLHVEEM
jgi:hypothetical protein